MYNKISQIIVTLVLLITLTACEKNNDSHITETTTENSTTEANINYLVPAETISFSNSNEETEYKIWKIENDYMDPADFYNLDSIKDNMSLLIEQHLMARLTRNTSLYFETMNLDTICNSGIADALFGTSNRSEVEDIIADQIANQDVEPFVENISSLKVTSLEFQDISSLGLDTEDVVCAKYSFGIENTDYFGFALYIQYQNEDIVLGETLYPSERAYNESVYRTYIYSDAKNWFDALSTALVELDSMGYDIDQELSKVNGKTMSINKETDIPLFKYAYSYCSKDGEIFVQADSGRIEYVRFNYADYPDIVGEYPVS